jgi:hypothetical protein
MCQYAPLLAACPVNRNEFAKIVYLTIHESTTTEEGQSQRRGGLHTETPGRIWHEAARDECRRSPHAQKHTLWPSFGYSEYVGGLYMASNVANSCRIWNCKVEDLGEVVGPLGDLEHLRSELGEGETLGAGEVVWITDATPHESLPLKSGTARQYFRLVTSEISTWYVDHSTPNPLGIVHSICRDSARKQIQSSSQGREESHPKIRPNIQPKPNIRQRPPNSKVIMTILETFCSILM